MNYVVICYSSNGKLIRSQLSSLAESHLLKVNPSFSPYHYEVGLHNIQIIGQYKPSFPFMARLTSKMSLFLFLKSFHFFYATNSFEEKVKIKIAFFVLALSRGLLGDEVTSKASQELVRYSDFSQLRLLTDVQKVPHFVSVPVL